MFLTTMSGWGKGQVSPWRLSLILCVQIYFGVFYERVYSLCVYSFQKGTAYNWVLAQIYFVQPKKKKGFTVFCEEAKGIL